MRILTTTFLILLTVSSGVSAAAETASSAEGLDAWALVSTVDTDRAERSLRGAHTFSLAKHFSIGEGSSIIGRAGMGQEYYAKISEPNTGIGTIWAARKDWPTNLADFEMSYDFRWVMPDKNFADCPFMLIGFRLNAAGEGYSVGMHGWTSPVLMQRISKNKTQPVGRGRYERYAQGGWVHLRIRAAGPILKAKAWKDGSPEPERWSAEAYDDWSERTGNDYKQGGFAVGFSGAKVFDTAQHEYKNIQIRPLTKEEVNAEVSFDPKTGASYSGDIGGTEAVLGKGHEELLKSPPAIDAKAAEGYVKDKNLSIAAGSDGLVFKSTDGKPAFLWLPGSKYHTLAVLQAKGAAGAHPLLGLRSDTADAEICYLDLVWRAGLSAMLYQNERHTGDIVGSAFKPDTWYTFVSQHAHTQTWHVLESESQKSIADFRYNCGAPYGKPEQFGIGVAGDGSVTVKGYGVFSH